MARAGIDGPPTYTRTYTTSRQQGTPGDDRRRISVQRQVPMPVNYDGLRFDLGFRADLLFESLVIVELKSAQEEHPVHRKQVIT